VLAPWGTFGDPAADEVFLRGGEGLVVIGRGHNFLGVGAEDAGDEFALFGLAGDDGGETGTAAGEGGLVQIQTEAGLAGACVGAVAVVAIVGEDRLYFPTEVDGLGGEGGDD